MAIPLSMVVRLAGIEKEASILQKYREGSSIL